MEKGRTQMCITDVLNIKPKTFRWVNQIVPVYLLTTFNAASRLQTDRGSANEKTRQATRWI